ncbi:26S proteasome non-ATPase regulatory subunit 2-like [Diadema setosum]|uniref:26S proteasome non-ATPase regulatory subunit 2-like n=1 Tax=Diadema setosum TaxID=31175 RepID=UPI003B3BCD92
MADTTKPPEKKQEQKNEKKTEDDKNLDLSEEDKQLQEELTMLVERLQEKDTSLYGPALEQLRQMIRASTSSMTSVPKPLKFLRPHYDTLKEIYEKMAPGDNKRFCADIVSVLGMTMSDSKDCLKYRLLGSKEDIASWGHEYARHLAGEIGQVWNETDVEKDAEQRERLLGLAKEIVPYHMQHNAEAEACDLLMEIEKLDLLQDYVDKNVFPRVCLYLVSCVNYVPEPEDSILLRTALNIFRKFDSHPEAMRLAIRLNDMELIEKIFTSCKDKLVQKQLAYMLGSQQIFLELPEETEDFDDLVEIMSSTQLNTHFLALARELDIMEPKVPEDIYKSHLESTRPSFAPSGSQVDSARQNLAASFVNGLVNAAFGQDKLLTEDGNKWIYKNKEHGMLSTTASLGLVLLWDVDGGLTQIDKYLYSSEDYIKSGALLACGIVNSGVRNECDPALALLSDYILHNNNAMRIGAIFGLGLAYAGSNREDVIQLLLPALADSKSSMEVVGVTALSLGLIAVGTCNGEVTSTILQTLMEKTKLELKDNFSRYLALGLALTYLGKQEAVEATLAALDVLPDPYKEFAKILVDVIAYAGTGNVLKVQHLLHICSEHIEEEEEKVEEKKEDKKKEDKKSEDTPAELAAHQAVAVLGIGIIAMGEEIGSEMALRAFGHLLRYGEPVIRRSVPLALALLSVSNPQLQILDTLSKFSHDPDNEVAHNAIYAMGIVGAGTNNARLAAMLRQLAQYHAKDPSNLFMVRLAQGLTHLAKGTLTLSPYHSDRQLLNQVALGGLLATTLAFLDVKNTILSKSHYLLYGLVTAMRPRMLVTFDEELRPLPVQVRVGQAVDVVGQAGKPKTITGFQTHTTPVLLAYGERAELATEEYLPATPIMEGFVILKKNPDYEQ